MIHGKHRGEIAGFGLRVIAALMLLATGWFGAVTSSSAQEMMDLTIAATSCDGSGNSGSCWNEVGARFTVTTLDGEFIGSCTLEGYGDEPYLVACAVPVPDGSTVIVTEDVSTITPGLAPEENPIYFDTGDRPVPPNVPSFWGPIFHNGPRSGSASIGQTSDVAIATTENGGAVTDACYVLVDFSNEGCDENGDGQVTFADVPRGTYTVHQTADLGPGRAVSDFTIQVTGNTGSSGWEIFSATVHTSGSSSGSATSGIAGSVDIALITRDPNDGHLLTGTCYVLVDASNEGCDENGDGQVTFADIPFGTYTVRQTQKPAGYPAINEYSINVEPVTGLPGGGAGGPLGFIVKQAPEQNAPRARNVSILMFDSRTGEKVTGLCAQIIDASNVGCDEDLIDGQIDFLDVQTGTYEVRFEDLPSGYMVLTGNRGIPLTVDTGAGAPTNQFLSLLVYVPNSASTGTGSGAGSSNVAAGSSVQGNDDRGTLVMFCGPAAACYGGTITITTEDGEFIGSCTMTGDIRDNSHPYGCAVGSVPRGVTVVLTLGGIDPGYAAEQNPVYFETTDMGKRASHDTGFKLMPTDGSTSTRSGALDATATEYGQLLGDWGRQHVYLSLNADGSGALTLNHGCCDGVTYRLAIDTTSSPFIATIVDAEFRGYVGPDESADIGETIGLQPTQKQGITVIVITMPDSSQGFQNKIPTCFGDDFDICNTLPFSD